MLNIFCRKNSSTILTASRKAIQACEKIKKIPLPNHSGYIVGGSVAGKGKIYKQKLVNCTRH